MGLLRLGRVIRSCVKLFFVGCMNTPQVCAWLFMKKLLVLLRFIFRSKSRHLKITLF